MTSLRVYYSTFPNTCVRLWCGAADAVVPKSAFFFFVTFLGKSGYPDYQSAAFLDFFVLFFHSESSNS